MTTRDSGWEQQPISHQPEINASNIFEQINLNELARHLLPHILIKSIRERREVRYLNKYTHKSQ